MITNTWPRDQYVGPSGGCYVGPGVGVYVGPSSEPYRSNIPPWPIFIEYLEKKGIGDIAKLIRSHLPLR